jgi:hypothetical protein
MADLPVSLAAATSGDIQLLVATGDRHLWHTTWSGTDESWQTVDAAAKAHNPL